MQPKIAPHSILAEESVNGSILINPEVMPDITTIIKPDDFFLVRNGLIFAAMVAIYQRGEEIDNLTVTEELRSRGQLETIGGSAYIAQLINNTPTHVHAETYAKLVERASVRRKLLEGAQAIAQAAINENAELDEVIDTAEKALQSAIERKHDKPLLSMGSLVSGHIDRVDARYQGLEVPPGLMTGFNDLDHLLNGLKPENLILVAARPGLGKSSLITCIARNIAKREVKPGERAKVIAVFSLEMNKDELIDRFISSHSNINSAQFHKGTLSEEEYEHYLIKAGEVSKWRIVIDDSDTLSVSTIRKQCRRIQRQHGALDLVIVDYLQLMLSEENKKQDNREQEVSRISRGLKGVARAFKVPVIAAAQLNRSVENRSNKRPMLADLRESGSLEQDADVVIFIYRDGLYNENSEDPNVAEFIVAKHRGGPTGTARAYWTPELTKFDNIVRHNINIGGY